MAKFNGTNGNDTITGTIGIDDIKGKSGNDLLSGLGGNDKIMGGTGDDDIDGGAGNDQLIGGDHNDTLLGGADDDVIYGDGGGPTKASAAWGGGFGDTDGHDDELDGGSGNDYVFGDGGNDLAIYGVDENSGAMDYYSGGPGIDALLLRMSSAQWFRLDVQNDIASYLTFVTAQTDPVTGEANGQAFDFNAFGLSAREFEDLRVVVDGVELTPEDDPVTANDDAVSLSEDATDTGFATVLGNDVVPDLVYDVQLVSGPAKGVLTFSPGTPGSPDGSYSFDPKGEFEYLAVGESEDVSFIYEVTDANRDTDQATVTITVTGENDVPDAVDDSTSTGENTPVSVSVLANDSDVDASDVLSVTGASISSGNGSVSLLGNQVHWDPGSDYDYLAVGESAEVALSYDISDGNGGSDSAAVTITVNGVNDDPTATDDDAETDEDTPVNITVLGNDSDPDTSDTLMVVSTTDGANGTVFLENNHSLTYTPDENFFGSDSFTYEVSDGNGGSDTATVTVTVNPVNDAPETATASVEKNEADGVFTINLADYVDDVDPGDVLSLSDVRINRGSAPIDFTVSPSGVIRIDPSDMGVPLDTGDVLNTQFSYVVTDDSGDTGNDSATGSVDLTINGVDGDIIVTPPSNAAPIAYATSLDASEGDATVVIPISSFATDVGDELVITSLTGPKFDGLPNQDIQFVQSGDSIILDPTQFFIQETIAVDPAVAGDAILSAGELANLELNFTVEDTAAQTASGVITLKLTGIAPGDVSATNIAPTAQDFLRDITVDAGGTFVVDIDTLIGDPDDGDPNDIPGDLTVTSGSLIVGTDEDSGLPITVTTSFDDVTNELTFDLTEFLTGGEFPLLDGESVAGLLEYTVSETNLATGASASTTGQIAINFINEESTTPPVATQRVLDFEPFADAIESAIPLDTLNPLSGDATGEAYEGFLFQGAASVIETNELGGGRGSEVGLINGQTTSSGHNVMLGASSTAQVPTYNPYPDPNGDIDNLSDPILEILLDGRGNPVLDETTGEPIQVPVTEIQTDVFALLAPDSGFGIGLGSQLNFTPAPSGGSFYTPADELTNGFGDAFNLDELSLNVAEGTGVTVSVTTYRSGVEEAEIRDAFGALTGQSNYFNALVAVDTFEFIVDAGTVATEIDFNDVAFADTNGKADVGTPLPLPTGGTLSDFDGIFAVSFETSTGTAVVLDDILLTI
jgi:VCBS repeat-containing protein